MISIRTTILLTRRINNGFAFPHASVFTVLLDKIPRRFGMKIDLIIFKFLREIHMCALKVNVLS